MSGFAIHLARTAEVVLLEESVIQQTKFVKKTNTEPVPGQTL